MAGCRCLLHHEQKSYEPELDVKVQVLLLLHIVMSIFVRLAKDVIFETDTVSGVQADL